MAIQYRLDAIRRRIETTVSGPISPREVASHINALNADQALAYAELIDARQVLAPFTTTEDVWQMAATTAALKDAATFGPRAIVVDDSIAVALTRMFAILVSPFVLVKTFCDMAEAERWLGERAAGE